MYIGKVEVDEIFFYYKVGDVGYVGVEYLVSYCKSIGESGLGIGNFE